MTKVYFNTDFENLVVEGTKDVWPAKSLQAALNNGQIEIWLKSENRRIIGPIDYSLVYNQNGVPFPTLQETKAYLDSEFAKSKEDKYNELSSTNW